MIRALAFLAASFLFASSVVLAQTYPSRHITLIIPFAAGGSNDIVGRAIGKKLSEAWGQPVVVENRPGAGGVIGASVVAAAPPDGYTLLLVSSTFTINPAIKKSMPFDTLKDFTPVAFIARSPLLVTASNNLPVNSMKELLEIARSQPGKITYASSGPGSINQISAELIALSAGVKFVHIPYRGGAPALNDLLGNSIDAMFDALPVEVGQVKSGNVIGLAVTGAQRSKALPDVPTMMESGFKDYEIYNYFGLLAPPNTPKAIVKALSDATAKAVASPDVAELFEKQGMTPVGSDPETFAKMLAEDLQRWTQVIKDAGITPQ